MIFFCGNQKCIMDVLRLGKTLSKDKDTKEIPINMNGSL